MVPGHLQEKKGRYYAVLDLYENGNRKQKWISTGLPVKGNKKRAEAILLEKRKEYGEHQVECKKDGTLFSDFMKDWLEIHRTKIEETTYGGYQSKIKRINEYFVEKKILLSELTAMDIDEFYSYAMVVWGNSANTIKRYHANIGKALRYAVKHKIIPHNPASLVELPQVHEFIGSHYNTDEVNSLFQAVKGTKLEIPVKLAAFYGLCRSELVGLKWDTISFNDRTISIKRSVTQFSINGTTKTIEKDRLKRRARFRALPLVDDFYILLSELKKYQDECKRVCGRCYNYEYDGYIFVDELGERINPDYISHHFPLLLKNVKLRHIRFHDLRHTSASLLLNAGVDLKAIQEWLGHKNYTTTEQVYAKWDPTSNKKTGDAMMQTGIKLT